MCILGNCGIRTPEDVSEHLHNTGWMKEHHQGLKRPFKREKNDDPRLQQTLSSTERKWTTAACVNRNEGTDTQLNKTKYSHKGRKQAHLPMAGGQRGPTQEGCEHLEIFHFPAMWWACGYLLLFMLHACISRVCVYKQYFIRGGEKKSTTLRLNAPSSPYTIFPLGPLILSKGIDLLRALSTYYHPFPSSQVKILSRRCKTKREMNLFVPQSKIYSRKISASTAHC